MSEECKCNIALNSNIDIDPQSQNCIFAVGNDQRRLRAAGCKHQDTVDYCAGKQVGPVQCQTTRQPNPDVYNDHYYFGRPYPSYDPRKSLTFGANCPNYSHYPSGYQSVGLLVDAGDGNKYSTCASYTDLGSDKVRDPIESNCPWQKVGWSDYFIQHNMNMFCIPTCETDSQCPSDLSCIPHPKSSSRGFCLGKIDPTNTFYTEDAAKLFEHGSECHGWDNCELCLTRKGITDRNQQDALCGLKNSIPGMFYSTNLDEEVFHPNLQPSWKPDGPGTACPTHPHTSDCCEVGFPTTCDGQTGPCPQNHDGSDWTKCPS